MWTALLESQFHFLVALELFRVSFLDDLFLGFHYLGKPPFYVIAILFLYSSLGLRKILALVGAALLNWHFNHLLKEWIALPRVFTEFPSNPLIEPSSWSLPSGHAQTSLFFWLCSSLLIRKPLYSALATTLVCGIGLSRLYLGVHYPTDVLAGWLIAAPLAFGTAHLLNRFLPLPPTEARETTNPLKNSAGSGPKPPQSGA